MCDFQGGAVVLLVGAEEADCLCGCVVGGDVEDLRG